MIYTDTSITEKAAVLKTAIDKAEAIIIGTGVPHPNAFRVSRARTFTISGTGASMPPHSATLMQRCTFSFCNFIIASFTFSGSNESPLKNQISAWVSKSKSIIAYTP
jgi:hypothetical protein